MNLLDGYREGRQHVDGVERGGRGGFFESKNRELQHHVNLEIGPTVLHSNRDGRLPAWLGF